MSTVGRALAETRNAGYTTDLLGVVNRQCIGDHWGEESSYHECWQAIAEAEQLLEPTDMATLRLLDELFLTATTWGTLVKLSQNTRVLAYHYSPFRSPS